MIRAKKDKFVNSNMKQREDRDFYLEKTLAGSELEKMGETIPDRRFKDLCVQGFTRGTRTFKMVIYRGPICNIGQMQGTMRHLYFDDFFCTTTPRSLVVA